MSSEPPFDPEALDSVDCPGDRSLVKKLTNPGPDPVKPQAETLSDAVLGTVPTEPPGRVSEPSAEYDDWLRSECRLEEVIPDPPEHPDTERPSAPSTIPSGPDIQIEEVDLIPADQLRAALARLEDVAKHAKDAAVHCFEQVQELRQVIALLPCMTEPGQPPTCVVRVMPSE